MGFLHLIQGLIMAFLASQVIQTISEFQPTIIQTYLTFDMETQTLITASKNLFDLPFGYLVASFLIISALFHGIVYIMSDVYFTDLKKASINLDGSSML